MSNPQAFAISRQGYSLKPLLSDDAAHLQVLFDQCADFFVMTNGTPAAPTAAVEEFTDIPDSKMPEDIRVFGLTDSHDYLIGTLIGVQQYPDADTWWIGLMLLTPEYRGQGIGHDFYRAFEQWIAQQGYRFIALCAISPNIAGRQFWQRMGFEERRKTAPRVYGTKTHEVHVYQRTIG
ncbi:MAG: GNAT family N-acetyltransferase [Cyanobacteria bacterium P01_D01_bin.44]